MAEIKKSTYKVFNGNDYDTHYLKTSADQVITDATHKFVTDTQIADWNGIYGKASKYADEKVAGIVGSAPQVLDTLNELANALGSDPNFATTMTNALAGKAALKHTHTPAEAGVIGVAPTSGDVAVFDGVTGKIKSTGFTIASSVPSGAKFTDTLPGKITTTTATTLTPSASEALTGTIALHKISKTGSWNDLLDTPTYDNYVSWKLKASGDTTGTAIGSGAEVTFNQAGATTVSRAGNVITISSVNTTYGVFNSTTNGLAPKSGGGTTGFLRADGQWVAPPDTVFNPATLNIQGNGTTVTSYSASSPKIFNIKPGSNIAISPDTATGSVTISNTYSYTHPTSAGNKHIPASGATNQILKYSSDGTAVWAGLSGKINDVAYDGFTDIVVPGAVISATQPAKATVGTIWIDISVPA